MRDELILTWVWTGTPAPRPGDVGCGSSALTRLLCDPGTGVKGVWSGVSWWLWWHLQVYWPLLVGVGAAALVVGALLVVVWVRAHRHAVDHAVWLEITPPAQLPTDGALSLWHALSGMLHRARRGLFTPRRMAVEFVADDAGVRVGVWVPPGFSAITVADAIRAAWPGTRVRRAGGPVWTGPISARELVPRGGEWAPLLEPSARLLRPAA